MHIIEGQEYKELLLEEIKAFDFFCQKNGIQYFLMWGTLLGAMRHDGFIPWDDDFDVILFRKDYEKLLDIYNANNDRYKLISYDIDKNFTAPLSKIIDTTTVLIQNYGFKEKVQLGVYIDLFILDDLADTEEASEELNKKFIKLTKKWTVSNMRIFRSKRTFVKDLVRMLYYLPIHIRGYEYYLRKINREIKKVQNSNSQFVGNISYVTSKDVFYREDFIPMRHKFEDIELTVPVGYERILTKRYGDWKKPPCNSEQKPHHEFVCYIED